MAQLDPDEMEALNEADELVKQGKEKVAAGAPAEEHIQMLSRLSELLGVMQV